VFVLDESTLGGPDLLALSADAGQEWLDITAGLVSVVTDRGGQGDGIGTTVEVGTLTARFKNTIDPISDPATYRPARPIRVRHTPTGDVLWSGVTRDLYTNDDKFTGDRYCTILADDAVAHMAGITIKGIAHPTRDLEPWFDRVARCLTGTGVPYVPAALAADGVTVWAHTGTDENTLWTGTNSPTGYRDRLYLEPLPTSRTLTGLTVGERYRVTSLWWTHVFGGLGEETTVVPATMTVDTGDTSTITSATPVVGVALAVDFTATATAHTLTVTADLTGVELETLTLARVLYVPQASNHLLDANVAVHLDLATRSAGVSWFVDRTGTVRVAPATAPGVALVASDVDPAALGYTNINTTFDTASIVNDVTLTNLARVWDGDAGEWVAADDTFGPVVNLASVATWGARTASGDVAIYAGPDYPFTDGLARLTARILSDTSAPVVAVKSLAFDATQDPAVMAVLDCFDPIDVTYRGTVQSRRVLSITHTITPRSWATTVTLLEA